MQTFPKEFADLLTPAGRKILDGVSPLAGALGREGRRFLSLPSLMKQAAAASVLALLEENFGEEGALTRMEAPIPPQSIWGMSQNYEELLPKASRVWTAMLESKRSSAMRRAERIGLTRMLRSATLHRFAEVLNGRPLRESRGIQLLCYRAGDYAGPHNDHHPEEPEAKDGYLDVHLTFCNRSVGRQLLVYEKRGHFSEVTSVNTLGGLTAYRLPFWHYTTPLEAKRGAGERARRFVLLATFTDEPASKTKRR